MAYAVTLIVGASFTYRGTTFKRGVRAVVKDDDAAYFRGQGDRFSVAVVDETAPRARPAPAVRKTREEIRARASAAAKASAAATPSAPSKPVPPAANPADGTNPGDNGSGDGDTGSDENENEDPDDGVDPDPEKPPATKPDLSPAPSKKVAATTDPERLRRLAAIDVFDKDLKTPQVWRIADELGIDVPDEVRRKIKPRADEKKAIMIAVQQKQADILADQQNKS